MVNRIEKIVDGEVLKRAAQDANGAFHCYPEGQTLARYRTLYYSLDDVAEFLIQNRRGRVRMTPGRALITDDIHIDGRPREAF